MKKFKSSLSGTKQVFAFTLRQMFRGKANIISLIILLLLAAAMPFITALLGSPGEMELLDTSVTTVYYCNESDLSIDFTSIASMPQFADSNILQANFPADEWQEYLLSGELLLHIYDDGTASVRVYGADHMTDEASYLLSSLGTGLIYEARLAAAGVTQQQLEVLGGGYTVESGYLSDYTTENTVDFDTGFAVQLTYSIVLIMLSMFAASFIIRCVIEEKSSKLVDTLLVSVRPLALIFGKVLAMMIYVFGLMTAMIVTVICSNLAVRQLLPGSGDMFAALGGMGIDLSTLRLGVDTVFVVLLSLLISYATFAAISAIAGVSCSAMEDMESANMSVVLVVMAGYLVSCFAGGMADPVLGHAVSFIPIISLFCAPVQYVSGTIGFPALLGAWAVQVAVALLLISLCAAVYEGLLLHKGERVKFRKVVALAFGKGGAQR